jgi:hypothetical protein
LQQYFKQINKMSKEVHHNPLFLSIKELIEQSKQQLAISVNATMSMLYWQIGKRINEDVNRQNRAESYGKQIVATLWRQLETDYCKSFSEKNLRRMMQFLNAFTNVQIVYALRRQLSSATPQTPTAAPQPRAMLADAGGLPKSW